jgi:Mg/Co/Ni transporter MgtE
LEENRPREGSSAEHIWIGDVADEGVPTCRLSDRLGTVRDRVRGTEWEGCVVTNVERIVLGLVRGKALEADTEATVESVMDPGPKTFRPTVTLEELLKSMRNHEIKTFSLVTTGEGRLIGAIRRADAEATFAHDHDHGHDHG